MCIRLWCWLYEGQKWVPVLTMFENYYSSVAISYRKDPAWNFGEWLPVTVLIPGPREQLLASWQDFFFFMLNYIFVWPFLQGAQSDIPVSPCFELHHCLWGGTGLCGGAWPVCWDASSPSKKSCQSLPPSKDIEVTKISLLIMYHYLWEFENCQE